MNSTGPLYVNSSVRRKNLRTGNIDSTSLLFNESLDTVSPGTDKGRLWVKNTTPNALIFTNENDADTNIGSLQIKSGGTSVINSSILDFVGGGISLSDGGGGVASLTYSPVIEIKDEGTSIGNFNTLDLVGNRIFSGVDGRSGTLSLFYNSTYDLQEEGVSLGSHISYKFSGSTISATDGGGGVADITVTDLSTSNLTDTLASGNDANGNTITNVGQLKFLNNLRVGTTISAGNNGTVSVGLNSQPGIENNVCIGANSQATFQGSVLIGSGGAGSSNSHLIQIGYDGTKNGIGYNVGVNNASFNGGVGYQTGNANNNPPSSVMGASTRTTRPSTVLLGKSASLTGFNNNVVVLGNDSTANTSDVSVVTSYGITRNLGGESVFRGSRIIMRGPYSTTDTTLLNTIVWNINLNEVLSVDCFVTERNTEGVIGTLNDNILYTFRDYFFRRKGSGTTVSAGTTYISNPDGAPVSTVALIASGNTITVTVTAADNDNRSWSPTLVLRGTDLT